jgi:hypothetical protein
LHECHLCSARVDLLSTPVIAVTIDHAVTVHVPGLVRCWPCWDAWVHTVVKA